VCTPAFHIGVHAPVYTIMLLCAYALGAAPALRLAAEALCFVTACLLTNTPGYTFLALVTAAAAAWTITLAV